MCMLGCTSSCYPLDSPVKSLLDAVCNTAQLLSDSVSLGPSCGSALLLGLSAILLPFFQFTLPSFILNRVIYCKVHQLRFLFWTVFKRTGTLNACTEECIQFHKSIRELIGKREVSGNGLGASRYQGCICSLHISKLFTSHESAVRALTEKGRNCHNFGARTQFMWKFKNEGICWNWPHSALWDVLQRC